MDTETYDTLRDFLLFESFLAEHTLIVFYLVCAVIIPVATWYFLFWLIRKYAVVLKFQKAGDYSFLFSVLLWVIRKVKFFRDKIDEELSWQTLTPGQKLKFLGLFVLFVCLAELFLRLTFEYLIAFMQMHEWFRLHPGLS